MTIPRSTYENALAVPRLNAFMPFAAWFLLMPQVALENSTVVYGGVASFAAIYLLGLIAGAAAARSAEKQRCKVAMVTLSAAGAVAGIGFAILTAPALRFLLYGIVAVASGALLALWAKAVQDTFDARSLGACLGFTAATSLGLRGLLALVGLAENLYSATTLMMLALSVLLAMSTVALAVPLRRPGTSLCDAASSRTALISAREGQIPMTVLCAASLASLFAQGLLFTPHYLDWEACAVFRAIADAAVAAICIALARLKPAAASWASESAQAFGIALALSGLMLCVVGSTCEAAGFALLGAATDVLFLSVLAGMGRGGEATDSQTTVTRTEEVRSSVFPLLLIATGQGWAFAAGNALKSWLGLGPSAFMTLYLGGFLLLAIALAAALGQMWLASASRARFATEERSGGGPTSIGPSFTAGEPFSENVLAKDGVASSGTDTSDTILYASEDNMQQQQAARETAAALKVIGEHRQEALAPFGLSPRETEIALLMMDGLTIAAAAEKMGVALGTAKFHLGNIYKKAGIQSKADLIALGRRYEYEIAEKEANTTDDNSAEDNG